MSRGTKTKTTIELNGQLYDARTGRIISRPSDAAPAHQNARPSIPGSGKVVDGFVRRQQTFSALPVAPVIKTVRTIDINSAPAAMAVAAPTSKPNTARSAPSHVKANLEKSKTLMRPAVKKPQPVIEHKAETPAYRFKKENHARSLRAASAQKSPLIRRFHPVNRHAIIKKAAVLPVVAQNEAAKRQISSQVAHLATSTEVKLKQSVDIIEESLRNASAHLETFEDNVAHSSFWTRFGFRNKAANLASLSFAGLLLVGFFGYQNAPNIDMRVAAAKSGVSAHMPGYSPAGFSAVRDVKSEPGKVSVIFRSNTDDKKFTVSQQASNWSSDSLLSNHVLASKQPYQTYDDRGKTVYIYDNSNATWVNGGVWYRVDGNASLSSDQLLRIANSL